MSEFADGNLAMISPPISGDFEYEGLITTDNFLGPLQGMTLDDFMMVLMSGDAYVGSLPCGCVGNMDVVMSNGRCCCARGTAMSMDRHWESEPPRSLAHFPPCRPTSTPWSTRPASSAASSRPITKRPTNILIP